MSAHPSTPAARSLILGRIRDILGERSEPSEAGYRRIPRDYRDSGILTFEACVALLVDRLQHYQVGPARAGQEASRCSIGYRPRLAPARRGIQTRRGVVVLGSQWVWRRPDRVLAGDREHGNDRAAARRRGRPPRADADPRLPPLRRSWGSDRSDRPRGDPPTGGPGARTRDDSVGTFRNRGHRDDTDSRRARPSDPRCRPRRVVTPPHRRVSSTKRLGSRTMLQLS
jgi:hypothetical protein